mgnify:CR=1 FL=1
MKIYIYKGGLSLVAKSGVGSAIRHQEKMLRAAKVTVTDVWKEADIVQINTVLPDSPLVARRARRQGKKVVYYGHSTMEDFKNSFIGSNLLYSKNGSAIVIDREMWLSHQRNTLGNC